MSLPKGSAAPSRRARGRLETMSDPVADLRVINDPAWLRATSARPTGTSKERFH